MRLTDFDVLTFDMIGTLIDFEGGILDWMRPRILRVHPELGDTTILEAYARAQSAVRKAAPGLLFSARLPKIWDAVADELEVVVAPGDSASFVACARRWPAFPDSVAGLTYLKRHFRYLVVVTNGDRISARTMAATLDSPFAEIITEEDIGHAKPDPKVFEHLIGHLGRLDVARERILHVAQSQYHDIGIARRMGLATCWVFRRHGQPGYGGTQVPDTFTSPDFLALGLDDLARQYELALSA